jgi:chromosome segregation ATPase
MLRISSVALVLLLFVPAAPCQKVDPESPTMQALLSEIRQLRQDLQTAAIAARRAQIVIYRLHEQEMAVERATERLENAKTSLGQIQMQQKYDAEQLKRFEEIKARVENEQERKQYDDAISNIRSRSESSEAEVQELQSKKFDLEQQLRIEEAKLQQLQDQLDRLDKDLENSALQASRRQP